MLNQVSRSGLQSVASDAAIIIACDPNAVTHDITLKAGTATAGTLTVTATPSDVGASEPVYYNGSPLTQDLSTITQRTYRIEGTFDSINIACAGSNGTYKYSYRGS